MHDNLIEVAAFYRSRASADLALADKLEADAKAFNGEVETVTVEAAETQGFEGLKLPEIKRAVKRPAPILSREIVPGSVFTRLMPGTLVESVKLALGGKANGRIGPMAKQIGVNRAELESVLTPDNGFEVSSKGWFKRVL